jgi:hypothetical protein
MKKEEEQLQWGVSSSMEIPQKPKDRTTIWSGDIISWVYIQRNVSQDTYIAHHVHYSIILNSQAIETAQMP